MKQFIIQLIQRVWAARYQLIRYFFVGITAFVLDMGSLYLLKEKFGFSPVEAVITNQPPIILFVFWTNKKWSFKAGGQAHKQLMKFVSLALMNYLISVVWMWFFAHILAINYLIAKVANIVLAVSWNFLAYKYWVYRVPAVHKSEETLLTD